MLVSEAQMSQKTISNKIVLGILDEFGKDFKFGEEAESKSFERLVNYVTLSKFDPEAFNDASNFDFIDVDKGGTYGIDTFALFINDTLILEKEGITQFTQAKRIDAKLVFIQSKRSTSFDTGEFLKFTSAVKNFLSDQPNIELSEELTESKFWVCCR